MGLAFPRVPADAHSASFEKFLTPEEVEAVHRTVGLETGDVLLIVADKNPVVFAALGALRKHLAEKLELLDKTKFDLLWVTDFPLFEYSEEEQRYVSVHHPFTHPAEEDIPLLETHPEQVRSIAYDIVINGYEAGGGSIRIHDQELQQRMFRALGFTDEQAQDKFGLLMGAFQYGAPPHGGLAFGMDRLTMILSGTENIKDVIAFPKVQNASELMTECPAGVEEQALKDLHIKKKKKE